VEESAALKAILLRLETAAVSGSWEVRRIAIVTKCHTL
jgi:hypothetical protein